MIKCPACGLENPSGSKFCTGCGAEAVPSPRNPSAACPGCGAVHPLESKFCVQCGTPLRSPQRTAPGRCPSCGADHPPGTRFCPACGEAVGVAAGAVPSEPASRPGPPGAPADLEGCLAGLESRLLQSGFSPAEAPASPALDRVFRRKKLDIAKAGMLTTVCGIKIVPAGVTTAFVRQFSEAFFKFAVAGKGLLVRNTFQPVLAYPVIITSASSDDVELFLNAYWPKHINAYEYPVVLSVSTGRVAMHRSTPLWMMALHGGIKRDAESLFAI